MICWISQKPRNDRKIKTVKFLFLLSIDNPPNKRDLPKVDVWLRFYVVIHTLEGSYEMRANRDREYQC